MTVRGEPAIGDNCRGSVCLFDDAILDVGDAGRLDRPHLLEFEIAHVVE